MAAERERLRPSQARVRTARRDDRRRAIGHITRTGALWRGFKRLTRLSWPRSFPLVQFPNAPLIVAFLAGAAASRTHAPAHVYLASISYLAMGVWAYLELVYGVNWFRHLLGLGYTISTAVHLALALHG
jgi:hypothetical protein